MRRIVLLVFEDLQWGDVPSVQFVDAALRTLPERPLMVLAFARPEVNDRFPGLWAYRNLQRMAVAPLTARSAQKLVHHILADLPADKAAWIVERANGNPFYLEELVRAAAAGGSTDSDQALPDTVIGMVQTRFDALGVDAKRVLRAASIFGNTFRASGVRCLVGVTYPHRAHARRVGSEPRLCEMGARIGAPPKAGQGREGKRRYDHSAGRRGPALWPAVSAARGGGHRRNGYRLPGGGSGGRP